MLFRNVLRSICMRKYNATFASSHIFSHQKNELSMRMTLRIVRACVCVCDCFVLWLQAVKMTIASFVVCLFVYWLVSSCLSVRYVVSYCASVGTVNEILFLYLSSQGSFEHFTNRSSSHCWLGHKIIAQHTHSHTPYSDWHYKGFVKLWLFYFPFALFSICYAQFTFVLVNIR